MTFIAPWKKNRKRTQHNEAELHGDQLLSAIIQDKAKSAPVLTGHEEKAKQSLDSIYALETIDVQSVRPLLQAPKVAEPVPPTPMPADPQLPLPFKKRFSDPFDVQVVPWIEVRGGIATRDEIEERLERTCCSSKSFTQTLIVLEENLFASDAETAKRYHSLISRAKTYFYHPNSCYPLNQLISWLEREYAKEWKSCPQSFIEKCLSSSQCFALFKTEGHQLSIRFS